jgi:hypothetical protein
MYVREWRHDNTRRNIAAVDCDAEAHSRHAAGRSQRASMLDALKGAWRGPHWRRWSFGAGAALAIATASIVPVVALLVDRDPSSLTLLVLAVEAICIALVGAGLLERLSGRMIAGGLSRQPHPDTLQSHLHSPTDEDRARRDQLTIRAGLIVLPVVTIFVALLFFS